MKFRVTANFVLEADDIKDAYDKLAAYLDELTLDIHDAKFSAIPREAIKVEPAEEEE